ncbi:hypothetical protein SprV_0100209600 [Sparganum proliferum]
MVSWDSSGPNVPTTRQRLLLQTHADHHARHRCPAATNHRHHPPCPNSCADHSDQLYHHYHNDITHPHRALPSPPTPTPRPILVPMATAHSPPTSSWSVTCEFIAQRLANQCLEHQPTLVASASTALTAHVHLATS